MTKLIHQSPIGTLEIPGVLGVVAPGEPFDAPDEIAASLLTQGDLYRHASAIEQLRFDAANLGIDTTGMKKNDIQAALAAAANQEVPQ